MSSFGPGRNRDLSSQGAASGAKKLKPVQDGFLPCTHPHPKARPREPCAAFVGNNYCIRNIYLAIFLELRLEKPNSGDFYLLGSFPQARR